MAVMALPDGRRLAYEVIGDPAGFPVMVLHGTPGSARRLASLDGPARDHGVAVTAPDRAGYGGSTYDPSRTIASGASDVGELMEHLGFANCGVVGLSGGGPTALACGVVLDRVGAVATVGGMAPLVPRDPSLPPDRLLTKTARHSQAGAHILFAVIVRMGRTHPEKMPSRANPRERDTKRTVVPRPTGITINGRSAPTDSLTSISQVQTEYREEVEERKMSRDECARGLAWPHGAEP